MNKLILVMMFGLLAACGPEPVPFPERQATKAEDPPPEVVTERLELRTDPRSGKQVLWDAKAQAVCERQPICSRCSLPWDQNPQYCVPIGRLNGLPTGLTPFALAGWFADPFCSVHLYGLPAAQAQAMPSWAYQFDEARLSAKIYRIQPASAAVVARAFKNDLYNPRSLCDRVTANEMAAAVKNVVFYIQVQEIPASEWVPWNEAQKLLNGSP